MKMFNPLLSLSMVVVILNLGAPLDYHLMLGAGAFDCYLYCVTGCRKIFWSIFWSSHYKVTKDSKKIFGFYTAASFWCIFSFYRNCSSVLNGPAPECTKIIQGTIAAAAVINEIIAVIMAKKGFEWAGEFKKDLENKKILTKL